VADPGDFNGASETANCVVGRRVEGVLSLVTSLRTKTEVPLFLFSYFIQSADGPGEEKSAVRQKTRRRRRADHRPYEGTAEEYRVDGIRAALDTISLAAPSLRRAPGDHAKESTGFLYLISRTGVTGAKDQTRGRNCRVGEARRASSVQRTVGFRHISQPGHVSVLGGLAECTRGGRLGDGRESARPGGTVEAARQRWRRASIVEGAAVAGMSRRSRAHEPRQMGAAKRSEIDRRIVELLKSSVRLAHCVRSRRQVKQSPVLERFSPDRGKKFRTRGRTQSRARPSGDFGRCFERIPG